MLNVRNNKEEQSKMDSCFWLVMLDRKVELLVDVGQTQVLVITSELMVILDGWTFL